jgi:hypothetical protein
MATDIEDRGRERPRRTLFAVVRDETALPERERPERLVGRVDRDVSVP